MQKRPPMTNHLLAALAWPEWQRWLPRLQRVTLPLDQVHYESGTIPGRIYFSTTAIVSLLHVLEGGASVEIAVVGHAGIFGVSIFMGGGSTPSRAVVQSSGEGYRVNASFIKEEFDRADRMHVTRLGPGPRLQVIGAEKKKARPSNT